MTDLITRVCFVGTGFWRKMDYSLLLSQLTVMVH